ncbi:FAD-binding protein [Streptomyces sp. SD15]
MHLAQDVRASVRAARDQGLPPTVRGGSHDWAGRAPREGGPVVDLSGLRQVTVEAGPRIATLQGEATAADVVAAAAPHGLSAATGTVERGILPGPDDSPTVVLAPTWCAGPAVGDQAAGDPAAGVPAVDMLRRLGDPLIPLPTG